MLKLTMYKILIDRNSNYVAIKNELSNWDDRPASIKRLLLWWI